MSADINSLLSLRSSNNVMSVIQKGAIELQEKQEVVSSLEGHSKGEIKKLQEQIQNSYEDQLKRIVEIVKTSTFSI